jgi:hypothetical protein
LILFKERHDMKKIIIALIFLPFFSISLLAQTTDEFRVSTTRDGTGVVITGYTGSSSTVNIPASIQGLPVKEIATRAFQKATITTVSIPAGVTIIGAYAFSENDKLYSVTLPNTLVTIGRDAFRYCSALTSITIPGSVTSIEQLAFANTGLRSVVWPASVAEIKEYTFRECPNLESVTLPEGLTRIENGAFYRCPALTKINMPSTIQNIVGNLTFSGCTAIPLNIQAEITKYGYRGNFK